MVGIPVTMLNGVCFAARSDSCTRVVYCSSLLLLHLSIALLARVTFAVRCLRRSKQ